MPKNGGAGPRRDSWDWDLTPEEEARFFGEQRRSALSCAFLCVALVVVAIALVLVVVLLGGAVIDAIKEGSS